MKIIVFVILLITVQLSAFGAETVEQRLVKLERTVKAQSDSIATYKAKVAEVEKQKSFLGDIYSTNIGWASLVLSLLVTSAFGLTVYTIYIDGKKLKKVKKELLKIIDKQQLKFKHTINKMYLHMLDSNYKLYKMNVLNIEVTSNGNEVLAATNLVFAIITKCNILSLLNNDDKEFSNKKDKLDNEIFTDLIELNDYFKTFIKEDLISAINSEFIKYLTIVKSTDINKLLSRNNNSLIDELENILKTTTVKQ